MAPWQDLDQHRFCVEGDLLFVEWHGNISLAAMQTVYEVVPRIYAAYGRALFLIDLSDGDLPAAPVRSWMAEWNRTHHELTGGAAFGAGLASRAMFLLIARAMAMVSKRHLPSALFATEPQARKWLDELRQKVVRNSP